MNYALKNHLTSKQQENDSPNPRGDNSSSRQVEGQRSNLSISEFVLQESREKCFEIQVLQLKEFEKLKSQIYDKEFSKITEQYQEKYKQVEISNRIQRSTLINDSRLSLMKARNLSAMKVFSDLQYKLSKEIREKPDFYRNLMTQLIIQGVIKLFEKTIQIRCLQKDIQLVHSIIPECQKQFEKQISQELGLDDFELNLILDDKIPLDQRVLLDRTSISILDYNQEMANEDVIQQNQDDKKCFGGVLLLNDDGLIVCKNTLDIRADLVFQEYLPEIRSHLFPTQKQTK